MAKVLSQITAIVFSWSLTDSLTQPLIKQLFKMEETCCTLYCTLSLSLGQKNAIIHLAFFLTKMLYRMVCISVSDPYSLNPDPDPTKNHNPDPDPDPGKFFSPAKKFA